MHFIVVICNLFKIKLFKKSICIDDIKNLKYYPIFNFNILYPYMLSFYEIDLVRFNFEALFSLPSSISEAHNTISQEIKIYIRSKSLYVNNNGTVN